MARQTRRSGVAIMSLRNRQDYGWAEAELDLAGGVHPEVVAARIGEPIAFVLETADAQGWPIRWKGPTPDQILDASGLDA
jgi:hypothetical protein